jgi:hypothetical protein
LRGSRWLSTRTGTIAIKRSRPSSLAGLNRGWHAASLGMCCWRETALSWRLGRGSTRGPRNLGFWLGLPPRDHRPGRRGRRCRVALGRDRAVAGELFFYKGRSGAAFRRHAKRRAVGQASSRIARRRASRGPGRTGARAPCPPAYVDAACEPQRCGLLTELPTPARPPSGTMPAFRRVR